MIKLISIVLLIAVVTSRRIPDDDDPFKLINRPSLDDDDDLVIVTRRTFPGCKEQKDMGFKKNVFYACDSMAHAKAAAMSVSPAGAVVCNNPHGPGEGNYYSHYHPATPSRNSAKVGGLDYHFHWYSTKDDCPRGDMKY